MAEVGKEEPDTCRLEDEAFVGSCALLVAVSPPVVPVIRQLQAELTLEGLPPHPSIHVGVAIDEVLL